MPVLLEPMNRDTRPIIPPYHRPPVFPRRGIRQRVLVADPCADTVTSMLWLLRLWDYDARGVSNGHGVLEAVRAGWPDVVLMELRLPGMDGCEVARTLHRQRGQAAPLLVALTGAGDDQSRRRAKEVGFDHHLLKPVAPDVLRRLLAVHQDRMEME